MRLTPRNKTLYVLTDQKTGLQAGAPSFSRATISALAKKRNKASEMILIAGAGYPRFRVDTYKWSYRMTNRARPAQSRALASARNALLRRL